MTTELGDILSISVDPSSNGGLDQAAALVTGVYQDGSLRLRVLGALPQNDTIRNYAAVDGGPYYDDEGKVRLQPPADPEPSPAADADTSAGLGDQADTAAQPGQEPAPATDTESTAPLSQPVTQPGQEPAQP